MFRWWVAPCSSESTLRKYSVWSGSTYLTRRIRPSTPFFNQTTIIPIISIPKSKKTEIPVLMINTSDRVSHPPNRWKKCPAHSPTTYLTFSIRPSTPFADWTTVPGRRLIPQFQKISKFPCFSTHPKVSTPQGRWKRTPSAAGRPMLHSEFISELCFPIAPLQLL
jgi:hypothetical protein